MFLIKNRPQYASSHKRNQKICRKAIAELLLEDLPVAETPVIPWSYDHIAAYGISDEECNYSYDAADAIERILTEQNDVQAYHKGNGNNES